MRMFAKNPFPDIRLRLQSILDHAYEAGRYGDSLDFDQPPEIPLSEAESKAIERFLQQPNASAS